jgi:hypothetical protein
MGSGPQILGFLWFLGLWDRKKWFFYRNLGANSGRFDVKGVFYKKPKKVEKKSKKVKKSSNFRGLEHFF